MAWTSNRNPINKGQQPMDRFWSGIAAVTATIVGTGRPRKPNL